MAYRLPDSEPNGPLCLAVETSRDHQVAHRIVLPQMSPGRFTGSDLLYSEETPHYTTGHKSINNFIKEEGNGEMALLLIQTFFFCKCIPSVATGSNNRGTVIYIDAYPGDHINYLAEMFPNLSFKLYDQRFLGPRPNKVTPSSRIQVNPRPFTEGEAQQIAKEFAADGSKVGSLYYISQLRNQTYSKKNTPERNSEIIDEDMWNQLCWAQIMKPVWSLIRYRPKLKEERTGISSHLTSDVDPVTKRSLYYNYPAGYFLRMPMAKRSPMNMHLMTCASQTNNYRGSMKTYYHDDIISLCNHQNLSVRRATLFLNPYTDTYTGIYGLDTVMEYVKRKGIESQVKKPERYICGAGWDHRAMFYIMTLYVRYSLSQSKSTTQQMIGVATRGGSCAYAGNEQVAHEATELILRILIEMELRVEQTDGDESEPQRVDYEEYD